jgi:hypothetical protein
MSDLEALEAEYLRLQAESEQMGPGPFDLETPEGDAAYVADHAAEVAWEQYAATAGIPTEHSFRAEMEHIADLSRDAENRAEFEALISEPEAS